MDVSQMFQAFQQNEPQEIHEMSPIQERVTVIIQRFEDEIPFHLQIALKTILFSYKQKQMTRVETPLKTTK